MPYPSYSDIYPNHSLRGQGRKMPPDPLRLKSNLCAPHYSIEDAKLILKDAERRDKAARKAAKKKAKLEALKKENRKVALKALREVAENTSSSNTGHRVAAAELLLQQSS